MNTEQKEKIKQTAETILTEHFNGAVGIDLIRVIPDMGMHGEDLARIIIVLDQDMIPPGVGTPLDLALRLNDCLGDLGLDHFSVTSFIGKSEWPKYKKGLDRAFA